MPDLPVATIPGHVDLQSEEQLQDNVDTVLVRGIIESLTVQPAETKQATEPGPGSIVFRGTLDEVNSFFQAEGWSDGLPIIPPTVEKAEKFLRYTTRPADTVLGVLLPGRREATVWNVAVNGVMAGCRPEYMPVLVAIVEAMADPKFGQEHLGQTPGTEVLVTINGPIIKDLDFNYGQGALRVGFQANTSIGRFWRLYLRNVAGFLPHKTDKATFGGTWRVVLAENEDALAHIAWEPMSVDQGFKTGDNVVTINSCTSTDCLVNVGADRAEDILDRLATRLVDVQIWMFAISLKGPSLRPQILITPCLAEALARGGYTKKKIRQHLYERARFSARRFEYLRPDVGSLCDAVKRGKLPRHYCESENPDRLVPIVGSPDDFLITVSGDTGKDNILICAQNGFIGYPTSKRIDLPEDWERFIAEARRQITSQPTQGVGRW
ncbi:MAG: hypothetical protein HYX90_11020 [Chloroflexi bacterium]|nr:hypothetical protein [Chloroflexota bacterium]